MRISPIANFSRIFIFVFLSMVLTACAISVNPTDNLQSSQEFSFTNLLDSQESLETKFSVNLINPLEEDETLFVEIIDEISGVGNHEVKHELSKINENNYETMFFCTKGSLVKYRYSKMNSDYQTELAADGSSIRYRLINCQDDYVQTDIISSWPDEPFSGKSGKITGEVVDQKSGDPLDNMLVSISGYQTFTDFLGQFSIEKLPIGNQVITVYSIDGSFETFQQTANIIEGLTTDAQIQMVPLPEINVTFIVTPPDDAKGAPIKMVGNLYQFGNTFSELDGGVSVLSSRSPIMTRLDDGRYKHQVKLHAGNDLRYTYTLGDGYWNTEQGLPNEIKFRQIILPNKDLIIEDKILGWRFENQNPKVIQVTIPENTPVSDSISIQFHKGDQWFEPLSMWPMGDRQWLYLLFTPLDPSSEIYYRFCRNGVCDFYGNSDDIEEAFYIDLLNNATTIQEINTWPLWQKQLEPTTIEAADIPTKEKNYLTGIELANSYHPSDINQINNGLYELVEKSTNWLILTPSWKINNNFSYPQFKPNLPENYDIEEIIANAQKKELITSIYPQIDFGMLPSVWWQNNIREEYWWQEWYKEYSKFILSYAQLAEKHHLEHIIIGGELAYPAMPGSLIPTESEIGTPGNADEIWLGIIEEIKSIYTGQVLLSLPFGGSEITQYEFMENIDGFYILFSPKISDSDQTSSLDEIKPVIGSFLDNEIKQLLDAQSKNIYLGLSYPAANGVASLCILDDNENCNDQTYIVTNNYSLNTEQIDLQEQVDIYNACLFEIFNRDWISGLSSRGFYFPIKLQDFSSSINGKPAADVLWYWYAGVKQ